MDDIFIWTIYFFFLFFFFIFLFFFFLQQTETGEGVESSSDKLYWSSWGLLTNLMVNMGSPSTIALKVFTEFSG